MAIKVNIISGVHKGKVGELTGVLHASGIALVKTAENEELAVGIKEILNVVKSYLVLYTVDGKVCHSILKAHNAQAAVDEIRKLNPGCEVYSIGEVTKEKWV